MVNDNDGTYKPYLFNGVEFCTDTISSKDSHFHVANDLDFITKLISKAEPEIKEQ